ncbi:MAG: DUF4838 domain-containing protein [Phycisphaeraceae bacterium]|nr:DUF4838 domain-containing protein [Phycisphaeraceae bacterium]
MSAPTRIYLTKIPANQWLYVATIVITLLCGDSISHATIPAAIESTTFYIVRDAKPRTTIIIPDNAVSCVKEAAKELQYHIRESSGATLKIVKESKKPSASDGLIYIGSCKATVAMGIDTQNLGPKTFVIKHAGGNLYLAGRDGDAPWLMLNAPIRGPDRDNRVGTLLAVYHFLDRFMGVRWLWPGKLGEVIPRKSNISIDSVDLVTRLPIPQSKWWVTYQMLGREGWSTKKNRNRFLRDQNIWLRRQGFGWNTSLRVIHSFAKHWKRFGQTHPEYFNLLPDGTRRSDPNHYGGRPDLVSMCVSQPALWQQIVEDWKTTRTPIRPYIDVSENDTPGKCVCSNCLAWDSGQPYSETNAIVSIKKAREAFKQGDSQWADHLGSLSDRYAKFMLAVQKLAQQTDPQATVMGFAYANVIDAPVATKLNKRVILGFVPQLMYPWTEAKRMRARAQIKGWIEAGASIKYRPNYTLCGHTMPIYYAKKLAEDFSDVCKNSVVGTEFGSLTGQFATQGPNLYVLARLHRNPARPAKEIFDEYYSAFGSAEPMVRAYFDHWEQVSNAVTDETLNSKQSQVKSPEGGHWAHFYRIADLVFTPKVMKKGRTLLAQAQEAAKGDPVAQRRVSFLEKGLKNAELTLATQVAYRAYKETGDIGTFVPVLAELDSYRAAIEGDHIANMGYLAWSENMQWNRGLVNMHQKGSKNLPDTWKFMWDPENKGVAENRQAVDFDDSQWFSIGVNDSWEAQPVGKQWAKEHNNANYNGFAWYRNTFEVNETMKAKQYILGFGAVDDSCDIWLNGQKILTRPFPYKGDSGSWMAPFDVNITKYVHFDKPNVLAVRVRDKKGAGGIWRGVWLVTTDMPVDSRKNLIKNGSFEKGTTSWKHDIRAGKFAFSIDEKVAHHGKQSAWVQCTQTASHADKPRNRNAWGRWHQSLPVKKGKTYTLRCFVKTSSDFSGRVQIFFTGDVKTKIKTVSCLNSQGRWQELVIDNYVAASNKAAVLLNQYGLGEVWFDDVEVVEVTGK